MQYIPLNNFFGFLDKPVNVYSSEELNLFSIEIIEKYQNGAFISVENKAVSKDEAIAFCLRLNHPGMVVFDQWICQNKNLLQLLVNKKLSVNNFDPKIINGHSLFREFSTFLSPFLLPRILEAIDSNKDIQYIHAGGYISLLNADSKLVLQDKLASWLKAKLSDLQENLPNIRSEQQLIENLNPLISDQMVEFVNQFTKAFYASKIGYIDQLLNVFNHPSCSARVGSWITGQLKKLALNPEHHEKIDEIKSTIKTGKFNFSNPQGKVRNEAKSLRNFTWIFTALLFVGLVYLFWFNPLNFWNDVPVLTDSKSSLEEFSKEERMKIDSLIKSVQQPDEEVIEQSENDQFMHLPPVEMNSIYRKPFQNKTAEQFYDDCLKDEMMMEKGLIDSCVPYSTKNLGMKLNPNFKSLSLHAGNQAVFLQNESEYQILVLVFSDKNDALYASIIQKDQKLNFKMNEGEIVLFLPGNDWAKFAAQPTKITEMPSENYQNHFCFQDENFKAMLYSPYRLKKTNEKIVKLMFNESTQSGEAFVLLDLYEALEDY
jgi:hypothetical protein